MELLAYAFILLAWLGSRYATPAEVSGRQLNFFGAIGKAIGGAVKGLGSIAQAAAPLLPLIPGIGQIGTIAAAALPALGAFGAARQGRRDSDTSRALTEQAAARSAQEAERAQAEFAAGAPLRDEFRSGAMSFGDPTNPFTQAMGGGLQQIIANAAAAPRRFLVEPEGRKPGEAAPAQGSSSRISHAARPATQNRQRTEGEPA